MLFTIYDRVITSAFDGIKMSREFLSLTVSHLVQGKSSIVMENLLKSKDLYTKPRGVGVDFSFLGLCFKT